MSRKNFELPIPWYWTSEEQDLGIQLHREVNEKHVLFNKTVKTIARRQDNDDVLFQVIGYDYEYAVVHLTWAPSRSQNSDFPRTEFYKDWDDLYENRILVDKDEFGEP